MDIRRDDANPRVLLYTYDENFGTVESMKINDDVTITDSELPECFGIKSARTCALLVPQDHQLSELKIIATNMWGGTATTTLPEIEVTDLNPVPPDPVHFLFDGIIYDWILIVLVLLFVGLLAYLIFKKLREDNDNTV